jgi:hypothetical protein
MWAELVRCHDILVLCILGAAITVLQAAPCHFIYKILKKFHWSFRLSFTIWVLLMILTWGIVWKNSPPTYQAWQPPELPEGCKTAYISIGKKTYEVPISDLSSFGNLEPIPDAFKFILKNNRIYLREYMHLAGTNGEYMTFENLAIMDNKLPLNRDWNCSERAFEIVNQDVSPVFQIIYSRPTVIRVNCIISLTAIGYPVPDGKPVKTLVFFGTNETVYTTKYNDDMRQFLLQYKDQTLFQYPSFNHKGQYRSPAESKPVQSGDQTLKTLGVVKSEPNVTLQTLGVVSKWHPPELPKGFTMVAIRLGGSTLVWSANLIPTNPIITGVSIPGFDGWPKIPISPYIKDNRLYVAVKNLLGTNFDTIFMNGDLDYPLPQNWDRNYDSNAFEIVAEDRLPVLQIAYLQPNVIQVNGIFFITTNYGVVGFGDGFEFERLPIGENDPLFFQRKAWFQYPSKGHLGESAIIAVPQPDRRN